MYIHTHIKKKKAATWNNCVQEHEASAKLKTQPFILVLFVANFEALRAACFTRRDITGCSNIQVFFLNVFSASFDFSVFLLKDGK